MRADALLALLLLAAPTVLRAQDLGFDVHFGSRHGAEFTARSSSWWSSKVLFDSGFSDPVPGEWDVLLIQGVLPDPNVRFQAARSGGSWVDLDVTRGPDGRFWAKGKFPRKAGPVRLRALDAGVAGESAVSIYGAEAFADAPETPAPSLPPSRGPVDPGAKPPLVHGRAEWRAVPPVNPYSPDPMPWRVTLHHTDGRYTTNLAESLEETRFIQDFHQHGRGWSDIGYHFLVDPLGNVLEGRPLETLGAHTLSNNEGNVGIVLLGTYHAPKNDQPTPAQLAAVASIGRFLVKRFGIDPASLKGHRDYKQTDCPGDLAYPKLPELRAAFGATAPVPSARKPRRVRVSPVATAPDWDGGQSRPLGL
ncbi:MAG: N-acetylmuramoyl-L-alanine amidase [Elusimicrobia bacterium]|nr:N-acetylmuramoyl-L-alanine amidase [Elusimicrobiota bacterium]